MPASGTAPVELRPEELVRERAELGWSFEVGHAVWPFFLGAGCRSRWWLLCGGSGSVRSVREMADLVTPMSIRVAATLGLVERAGDGGATAERLAAEVGACASALRRLLDHLVAVGVFDFDALSGRFRPTRLGAQMGEAGRDGINLLLDINSAGGRAELAFVELLGTVTTGAPAYPRRYGRDFWSDLDVHPELRRTFDAQMSWRFRAQAPQIAEQFDWGRFGDVVDVGGGDGLLLVEILRAHPGVRGRVVDLAPAAAAAGERFAAAGMRDRAVAVAGASSVLCRLVGMFTCCRTSCTTGMTSMLG